MADKIILRSDIAENWNSVNPILEKGEQGWDNTAKQMKVGDGVTHWRELPYLSGIGSGGSGSGELVLWEGELKEEDAYIEEKYVDSSGNARIAAVTNIPFNAKLKRGSKIRIYITYEQNRQSYNSGAGDYGYGGGGFVDYILEYVVGDSFTEKASTIAGLPQGMEDFEFQMNMLSLTGIMECATYPYPPLNVSAGTAFDFYGVTRYSLGGQAQIMYNGDKYLELARMLGEELPVGDSMMFKNGLSVLLSMWGGSMAGIPAGETSRVWWNYSADEKKTQILQCRLNWGTVGSSMDSRLCVNYTINRDYNNGFTRPVVFKKVTLKEE